MSLDFTKHDFQMLHFNKIHLGNDYKHLSCQYFFCIGDKILFVHNSRKYYQLMASCQCGFEPIARDSYFEILFSSQYIDETINMFKGYCLRLLELENELH